MLALTRKYIQRELLRLGLIRFVTNYIASKSFFDNKPSLRVIMTSDEWRTFKYVRMNDGRCVEGIILSNDIWNRCSEVVKAVEPLYVVLQIVDTEKFP